MRQAFSGYQCWRAERIGAVINKEALSVSRASFLATHVPLRHITYEKSPQQIRQTDESSFLFELDRATEEDRHVFAAVKGIPGTGKSHLIRWLKEQYALRHPTDVVLLVARSNSSLRATIQQIIDSHLFDTESLPEQLRRLQSAVEVLTRAGLEERLLNTLQEATRALDWESVERRLGRLHRHVTPSRVEGLLLDVNVRERLKEEDAPIARVASFLTTGSGDNQGVDRVPGFEEADLEFDVDFLRRLRNEGAYREVLNFCNDLHQKTEIRESTARYLSFALHNYAISAATELAAGDLRTMFGDLRRHLRGQGKNLALFIEDITAFTGIDEGLVEVLITQHTGEANAEFCRLISIIGVTDGYYADRFPDNIRERITHVLTLNASGRAESDLMQDSEVRAEFAARYLNAMRLSQTDLTAWAEHGARPDALPNACADCPFVSDCHAGFENVRLQAAGAPSSSVGLYPFNRTALDTLYGFLREGVGRTPRTFLNSILAYVMQSHGDKIGAGEFPPPAAELATDVDIPSFNPPAHERVVIAQGRDAARRLSTLFLVWGDRNVHQTLQDGVQLVGGVPQEVFRAFRLPLITGVSGTTVPPQKSTKGDEVDKDTDGQRPQVSKLTENIEAWANGGMLHGYDRFTDWLADLARSFINWQNHGISPTQVREYVAGGRFAIEGQTRAMQAGRLYLEFKKSNDLRHVLQALADLNDGSVALSPDQFGEHLATLSVWIRHEEARIVSFVREPTQLEPSPLYLTRVLLVDCVLLACLTGDLTPDALSSIDLYQQVVASCARSSQERWRDSLDHQSSQYSAEWTGLMRKLNVQHAVHVCRSELLQLLNRPQGASTNVRFLDAATALDILADFNDQNWALEPLSVHPATTDQTWSSAVRIYEALVDSFWPVMQATQNQLKLFHSRLRDFLADGTPAEIFEMIRSLLISLRQVKAYPPELDEPFGGAQGGSAIGPGRLVDLVEELETQFEVPSGRSQALHLCVGYARWNISLRRHLEYFERFEKAMKNQQTQLQQDLQRLRSRSNAPQEYARTLSKFDEVIALLEPLTAEVQR